MECSITRDNMIEKLKIFLVTSCIVAIGAGSIMCVIFTLVWADNQHEKTVNRLGHSVVIGKDTLMIIDYSGLNHTYSLSNGSSIDIGLADKLKTVK